MPVVTTPRPNSSINDSKELGKIEEGKGPSFVPSSFSSSLMSNSPDSQTKKDPIQKKEEEISVWEMIWERSRQMLTSFCAFLSHLIASLFGKTSSPEVEKKEEKIEEKKTASLFDSMLQCFKSISSPLDEMNEENSIFEEERNIFFQKEQKVIRAINRKKIPNCEQLIQSFLIKIKKILLTYLEKASPFIQSSAKENFVRLKQKIEALSEIEPEQSISIFKKALKCLFFIEHRESSFIEFLLVSLFGKNFLPLNQLLFLPKYYNMDPLDQNKMAFEWLEIFLTSVTQEQAKEFKFHIEEEGKTSFLFAVAEKCLEIAEVQEWKEKKQKIKSFIEECKQIKKWWDVIETNRVFIHEEA